MLKEYWNYNNPEQRVQLQVANRFSTALTLEPLDPNAVAADFRQRAATRVQSPRDIPIEDAKDAEQ